jgi:hypothetical protein
MAASAPAKKAATAQPSGGKSAVTAAKNVSAAKKETAAKPEPAAEPRAEEPPTEEPAAAEQPAAEEERAPRRPAKKNPRNRRSSVPSWDEIMLGSSRQHD